MEMCSFALYVVQERHLKPRLEFLIKIGERGDSPEVRTLTCDAINPESCFFSAQEGRHTVLLHQSNWTSPQVKVE